MGSRRRKQEPVHRHTKARHIIMKIRNWQEVLRNRNTPGMCIWKKTSQAQGRKVHISQTSRMPRAHMGRPARMHMARPQARPVHASRIFRMHIRLDRAQRRPAHIARAFFSRAQAGRASTRGRSRASTSRPGRLLISSTARAQAGRAGIRHSMSSTRRET